MHAKDEKGVKLCDMSLVLLPSREGGALSDMHNNDMKLYHALLLEDEKATRHILSKAIKVHPELRLVDAIGSCKEALAILAVQKPDILVADLGLPDGNGIKVIAEAKKQNPEIEILVVTMFDDEQSVVAALEAGASSYLLKSHAFEEIGDAIIGTLRGESAISPEIARYLIKRFNKQPEPETEPIDNPLTSRESEVLSLIAKGYSYDEIANAFELSTNTVRAHIRNIYRKLAVSSRSEAVFEATHLGLIQLKE